MKYTQVTTSLIIASAALAAADKINEKNVVNSNVQIKKASSETTASAATTAEFADAPLSTAVTTDANGATVTSYVWWEASTTATEAESSATGKTTKAVESSATDKTTKATATSASTGSDSSALSVTTAEFADAPLSTAVTTDANGSTVTSYVWWEASTTASSTDSLSVSSNSLVESTTGSSASTTGTASSTKAWDEPLYTTTETLSNGEVTTQEIWWTPSVTSNTLAESTDSSSGVSTSSETYTSNGSTFTTQTLITLAAKKDTNNSSSNSSTHYTVVNGTTEAVNGVAGRYQDSMYVALGAAVIGLLV